MHKVDTSTGAYFLSNSLPQTKENIFTLPVWQFCLSDPSQHSRIPLYSFGQVHIKHEAGFYLVGEAGGGEASLPPPPKWFASDSTEIL